MSKKVIVSLAVLLLTLQALAAPPKLEAGSYRPFQAGTSALRQVDYRPGMVTLHWKSGKVIEVPVLQHLGPSAGGSGVLVLAADPTEVQHPFHDALVYELTKDKHAVWLTHRRLSGNRNTAGAQARALNLQRVTQSSLFVTPAVAEAWNALPEADPKNREVMLAFLWETVHYGWAERSQTDRHSDIIWWLLHHGYNPLASFKTAEGWIKEHSTDQEVQQAVEEVGRNAIRR